MSSQSDDDTAAADSVVNLISRRGDKSLSLDEHDGIDEFSVLAPAYRIEQYAQSVSDFSSQYGSDYSISYTAHNIIGRPSKYPDYGDFPETFAMRTYGDWWLEAPSKIKEIQPQNYPPIPANDYIVIYFEDYVVPEGISIFETFNPGAVVRIWAYTLVKTWICIWEATSLVSYTKRRARCFSPTLKKIRFPTKTIRIEFNHKHLNYFTEIDAVLLYGRTVNARNTDALLQYCEHRRKSKGTIMGKLQTMQFRPNFNDNYQNLLQDFLINDLKKFTHVLADNRNETSPSDVKKSSKVHFFDMPFEILLHIFSYLDLESLFKVGQVSRLCYDVSTHPLLYSEINLKPYWHLASTDLLCTLAKRATYLKKFDFSWCGLHNSISPTEFKKFIQQRGDTLTHLRLNSCKFLNPSCIETIGIVCDNLKELSLRNIYSDSSLMNFSCLGNLKNLERLDLFQTVIESDLLLTMLESNQKLKHLNLAFCGINVNMNEVAIHIGLYNRELVSLDMWKSHDLNSTGLQALSMCPDLEELDVGWCLRDVFLGSSLRQLVTRCPKLKKLFLATVRALTDRDMQDIANYCPNLEQLDLMGMVGIAKEHYYQLLVKCKKLKLLDLSFCDNIEEPEISLWARTFKVHIKCSHVPAF